MTTFSAATLDRSLALTAVQGVLTSVHHVYGGLRYGTSWRVHGVLGAGPLLAGTLLLGRRLRLGGRPVTRVAYQVLSSGLFGLVIGGYEGGYNHVLKDVLYFGGLDRRRWERLFPPRVYEAPDDVFFEVSGVLQAVVGAALLAANATLPRDGRRTR